MPPATRHPAPGAFERWNDFWDRPRARTAAYIILALLLVGTGIWSIRQLFTDSSEFGDFYDIACRTVLTHQDIFDGFPHKRAYPPFFGLAFYPFCWSTKLVGIVLFWAFNSMCFILCPLLCVRTFWPPGRAPRFGVCVLLWMMAGGIMMDVMVRCETDLIILLALCAGLYLLIHRNRSFWAGAAFSFAAAVKVTPAFLGFYLLWRRNWRAVAGMIVGVIFFVGVLESGVFGLRDNIQRHRRWWTEVVEPYHKRGPRAFIGEPYRATNQSLTAAAFRYLTHTDTCTGAPSYVNIVQWDDATVRKIGKIAGMVLLIGLLFLWWGKGISQSPIVRGAEFSTALIAMLELSEVSLLTHHVVLLVPFAVELVYLAAWQPPLATRPSPLAPRPIRVIAGGMAISFLFLGLCVIPTFKALSFFFFATMVQLAILVFLILRLRANDDGKVPGTL